jgi:hypothetical protein
MQPGRVVAGAVREDGVGRQPLAQDLHHRWHLDGTGMALVLEGGQVFGMRLGGARSPARRVDRRQRARRGGELRHAGVDRQRRLIDAAQLLGAGMDVDQRLLGNRHLEQRVAAGRHLAQAGADHQQDVGLLHARGQGRIGADADMAGIVPVRVVHQVLAAEGGADRQSVGFGEGGDVAHGRGIPATAAQQQERALGLGQ